MPSRLLHDQITQLIDDLQTKIEQYQNDADRTMGSDHSYAEGRRDAYLDMKQRLQKIMRV